MHILPKVSTFTAKLNMFDNIINHTFTLIISRIFDKPTNQSQKKLAVNRKFLANQKETRCIRKTTAESHCFWT